MKDKKVVDEFMTFVEKSTGCKIRCRDSWIEKRKNGLTNFDKKLIKTIK